METSYSVSKMAAATLFLVMAMVPAAVAVTYTVGGVNQWATGVDYAVWVTGKTFRVGDILEFKYGPTHSLDVVEKAGYDSCDGSSASEVYSDGDNPIELQTVGTKYFICPTPGHCANGMKLAVTVVATSPATPSPPSPSLGSPPPSPPPKSPLPVPPPPTPDLPRSDGTHEAGSGSTKPPPPPPSVSPPPPSSSAASSGLMSYIMVGISLVLTLQCVVCG